MNINEEWEYRCILSHGGITYLIKVRHHGPRREYQYQIYKRVSSGDVYSSSERGFKTLEEACTCARNICITQLTGRKMKTDEEFNPLNCFS